MTTMLGPAVDGAGVDLGDELAGLFDPETGTMRTSLLVPAPGPVVIPGPRALKVDKQLVAQLVADAQAEGLSIDGENGLLSQLTKLILENALEGEMTAHLGYDKYERAQEGTNSRNGTRSKTVLTKGGPIEVEVPRDRDATFEPQIIRKRQRRLGSIEGIVLSLSPQGYDPW